ncbi:MAG: YihY/virulence factor BrkB family protein [Phormidium sp. BM_Day4_Bin.17]|nr:YihY/virulence factor BrkB family protein [Phormidium sp. BM_Day4_Bin.17]UCJ11451.1 MAG: YihY/virulence factor BrkB family protein [Phormidium sp. PBR-2020]
MFFRRSVRFLKTHWFDVLRDTCAGVGRQRLVGLSSEVAFNAMLAMFPAIMAALAILGQVLPERAVLDLITENLKMLPPEEVQNILDGFIGQLELPKGDGLFSLSFAAALWIASAALSSIMNALDRIYRVPKSQTRPFWKAKLISIVLTVGSMLMLAVASILIIISDFIVKFLVGQVGEYESELMSAWYQLTFPLALTLVAIAFAFIYRYGPSIWKRGTPVIPGAIVATVLWAAVSNLFRLYVASFGSYNLYYGAVGAAIVLLLWLKLSALAILLGAQLNMSIGRFRRRNYRRYRQSQNSPQHSPQPLDSSH